MISRFDPTPSRTPEECERHYTQVHVHMAQDLLRPMPALMSYHTDRAVAQADVDRRVGSAAAGVAIRGAALHAGRDAGLHPRAERDGGPGSRQLPLPPAPLPTSRRPSLLDRRRRAARAGQVHASRPTGRRGVSRRDGWAAFSALAERVRAADGRGVRRAALIVNRVLNEVECEPVDVEGQRPIGLLDETTRVGYIEAYFDHPRWGREALASLVGRRRPARPGAGRRQPPPAWRSAPRSTGRALVPRAGDLRRSRSRRRSAGRRR